MSIKYELAIDCGNAAFDDGNIGNELARILRKEADRLELESECVADEQLPRSAGLMDINGNHVGMARFSSDTQQKELERAYDVVLNLANENVIDAREYEEEHEKQSAAIELVEAHKARLFGDGK